MNASRKFLIAAALTIASLYAAAGDDSSSALVKIGDPVPEFTVVTTDGARFTSQDQKGKVTLITFFATWCVPCMQEMPHLESDVWKKFKDRGLVLVAIGREHQAAELRKFKADRLFTMPIAADPDRTAFSKFAKDFIPRAFLVGANGKIVFESEGYDFEEFPNLVRAVEAELDKEASAAPKPVAETAH